MNESTHPADPVRCPGSGTVGLKLRDGLIRCTKCKKLMPPWSQVRNTVPPHTDGPGADDE